MVIMYEHTQASLAYCDRLRGPGAEGSWVASSNMYNRRAPLREASTSAAHAVSPCVVYNYVSVMLWNATITAGISHCNFPTC